tara:strand:+ start:68 stop:349 length:282 start_codon:yes stop_codon:yes gene_type:complete
MKKVTVKKIWNNRVSVKGTDLEAGLKKGGLIIVFEGLQMSFDIDLLRHRLQGSPDSKPIKSKFNNSQPYYLYDFQWVPEKKAEKLNTKQGRLI